MRLRRSPGSLATILGNGNEWEMRGKEKEGKSGERGKGGRRVWREGLVRLVGRLLPGAERLDAPG